AFTEAQTLLPGDAQTAGLIAQAQKARDAAAADTAKKRAAEQQAGDVKRSLDESRAALAKRDFKAAIKAYTAAAKIAPNDPAVLRMLEDLRAAQQGADTEAALKKKREE